jgi:hypothetical protein
MPTTIDLIDESNSNTAVITSIPIPMIAYNHFVLSLLQVLSFPIGKIFFQKRLVSDFNGGTLAHEIISEMLSVRDDLVRQALPEITAIGGVNDQGSTKKDEL